MPLQLKLYGLDCAEEVAMLKCDIGPVVRGEQRLKFDILRAHDGGCTGRIGYGTRRRWETT